MAAKVNGFISTVFELENSSIGLDTECIRPAKAAATITNKYPKRGDGCEIFCERENFGGFNIYHNKSDV